MPARPPRSVVIVLASALVLSLAGGVSCARRDAAAPAPAPRVAAQPGARPALEYAPVPIGAPAGDFGRPMVTNVQTVDLDRDGLLDVLYCEAQGNTVRWIRQAPRGVFTEQVIARDIPAPAHVWTGDVNGTGRSDVLVASMGQIAPNNDRIGAVVVLENLDNRSFRPHVLLDHVPRVTDVRGANLAGHAEGRLDLVVGQFGYAQGETRWMENKGGWEFASHIVNTQSGCVNTVVADFDGDRAPDFAAIISQEWEEVHVMLNSGHGEFRDVLTWGSTNEDYGSSGLATADVNGDGRTDLIYTNGDGFDYAVQGFRPWHGLQWLENRGTGFAFHRVGDMPGAYSPCAADLNGDGAMDLLAVSCFADWADPKSVSLMAWLNDGHENFTPVVLAHKPNQLVTAAVGDLDGNGVPVIVTGGFYAVPPFDAMSNITLWRKK
jgi:FG-GAP-like repeat